MDDARRPRPPLPPFHLATGGVARPYGGAPGPIRSFREDPRSFFARIFNYWTLRHAPDAHAYLQPSDDVFNKINDSWIDGMKLFSSIFGISLMELALARAPEPRIGRRVAGVFFSLLPRSD